MELRKLQKTPDGTYFVTLPKNWVTRVGADRGAVLSFSESKDGRLLLSPISENERKLTSVTLAPGSMLEREIEEKYLLGFDTIEIESNQMLGSDVRDRVKAAVKRFVGLEIVEEDSKRIVVQCLIEPSLLVPEKIVRRLHLITTAMQKDSVSAFVGWDVKLASTVIERDQEVNRTYFLLVRVVRAALTDSSLAHKLNVTPIDCLDYRLLGSFIEDFGDHSVTLAQSASDEAATFSGGFSKAIDKSGNAIHAMYDSAVEAVLTRNLKLVPSVEKLRQESDQFIRAAERFLSGMDSRLISKATSGIASLRAMAEVNIDIADLAVTR